MWSRLDFVQGQLTEDELNALWEIQQTGSGIRNAFIAQLQKEPAKLGYWGAPVFRALYLKWPADVAEDLWDAMLQAAARAPDRAAGLASVAQVAPGSLTSAQAQSLLDLSHKALTATPASPDYAYMLAAVSSRLPPDRVPEAISTLLTALSTATAATRKTASQALELMPGTLTAEQSTTTLASLLTLFAGASEGDIPTISQAVEVVARKSAPGDARSLAPLLTSLDTMSRPDHLAALAPAVRTVRDRIPVDQAQPLLARQVKALAASRDPDRLILLASVVEALPGTLADDQAHAPAVALTRLLLDKRSDTHLIRASSFALQALAGHMSAHQADPVRALLLPALRIMTESSRLSMIAQAVRALPGSVTPDQVHAIRAPILATLSRTADSFEMRELAVTLVSLEAPLSVDEAEALIAALGKAQDDAQVGALATPLLSLGAGLPPAAARSALATLVTALTVTSESEALKTVAIATGRVPGTLTLSDAQPALAILFKKLLGTSPYLADYQLDAVSLAIRALVAKLDAAEVPSALEPLVTAFATEIDAGQLAAMLVTLTAAADALRPADLDVIRRRATALLAWSTYPVLSSAAAQALSAPAIRRRPTPADEIKAIVDVLRFPAAAAAPTAPFLGVLRSLAPSALRNATLEEILDWIARDHPTALTARPVKPERPAFIVRKQGGGF